MAKDIPMGTSHQLIKEIHEMYGHPGCQKTMKLLEEGVTFDRMVKTIKPYGNTI